MAEIDDAATLILGAEMDEEGSGSAAPADTAAAEADGLLDLLEEGTSAETIPGAISGDPEELRDPAVEAPSEKEAEPAEPAAAPLAAPLAAVAAPVAASVPADLDAGASTGVKRAATLTLDMGEDLFPAAADEEPLDEHAAVLSSTNPATAKDIRLTAESTSVGRESSNSIVLDDPF